MIKSKNYINGQLTPPSSGDYFDNSSPVDGQVYSKIPDSNSDDIDIAVSAAKNAFPIWSKLSKKERYVHIMRLADEIDRHFDELVEAESKDNGKPEWLARSVDIPRASENFTFFGSKPRDTFVFCFGTLILGTATTQLCLLYTSPSPRDQRGSRMPSSA